MYLRRRWWCEAVEFLGFREVGDALAATAAPLEHHVSRFQVRTVLNITIVNSVE